LAVYYIKGVCYTNIPISIALIFLKTLHLDA